MEPSYDYLIVGGGVMGASFASALLGKGKRVALCERYTRPSGGSVRNFGLGWPFLVSQWSDLSLGLRTREIHMDLARHFDFGLDPSGALLVAGTEIEEAVLTDFQAASGGQGLSSQWLDGKAALARQPLLNPAATRGGLFIPEASMLDPRIFTERWLAWMAEQRGLAYFPATTVTGIGETSGGLTVRIAGGASMLTGEVLICGGEEFQTLFPQTFVESGIRRCKLAMLQTEPLGLRPGTPGLAFGRSLAHYPLFASSPSFERLRAAPTDPACDRLGIHLLVKPCPDGSVVIGDSHEYSAPDEPPDFDYTAEVEALLVQLTSRHLQIGTLHPARRWLGYYAKHPEKPWLGAHPMPGVTIVTGLTIGMSAGPAFAERMVAAWLGRA